MRQKVYRLDLREVENIPEELQEGILYYSLKYHTAAHLCPCGCGSKVVTPITYLGQCAERNSWGLQYTDDGIVTLTPSVGNFQLPCKSHYFVRSSRIEML